MMELPTTFLLIIFFFFGAAIGSFLNVIIWRIPRKQKITGRSRCPKCKKQLKPSDLIPIWSYKASRKQCKYCQQPISSRYVIVESITALLFMFAFVIIHPVSPAEWLWLFTSLFVISVLIITFAIDLEHYLILDKIIIPATVVVLALQLIVGIAEHGFGGEWYARLIISVIGTFVVMAPLYLLWLASGGKWMGFGDVKFAGFLGAVLGSAGGLVTLFLAFILGTIAAIPLLILKKKELTSKIPFGTFLSIAALIALFYGQQLLQSYLRLIGL